MPSTTRNQKRRDLANLMGQHGPYVQLSARRLEASPHRDALVDQRCIKGKPTGCLSCGAGIEQPRKGRKRLRCASCAKAREADLARAGRLVTKVRIDRIDAPQVRVEACEVRGCGRQRHGIGRYCRRHGDANNKHGHPEGRRIKTKDLWPYLSRAARMVRANRDHPRVKAATSWFDLRLSEATRLKPEVVHSKLPPKALVDALLAHLVQQGTSVSFNRNNVRLDDLTDAQRLLVLTLAMYMLEQAYGDLPNSPIRSQEHFEVQLARLILRATPRSHPALCRVSVSDRGGRHELRLLPVAQRISIKALRLFGRELVEKVGFCAFLLARALNGTLPEGAMPEPFQPIQQRRAAANADASTPTP
jgi:hypothetical protein